MGGIYGSFLATSELWKCIKIRLANGGVVRSYKDLTILQKIFCFFLIFTNV